MGCNTAMNLLFYYYRLCLEAEEGMKKEEEMQLALDATWAPLALTYYEESALCTGLSLEGYSEGHIEHRERD